METMIDLSQEFHPVPKPIKKEKKAKTVASKKAKGKRLETFVAKKLRTSGLDKDAKRMPGSGAFEGFKSDTFTKLPFTFEQKNQEKVKLWQWWEQAKSQEKPFKPAVLVVGGNYRKPLVVIEFETFINLLQELQQLGGLKV